MFWSRHIDGCQGNQVQLPAYSWLSKGTASSFGRDEDEERSLLRC